VWCQVGGEYFKSLQPFLATLDVRVNSFAKEAFAEAAQTHLCLVVVAAVAGDIDLSDSGQTTEKSKPLTGGTFRNTETLYDLIQCQWHFRGVEQAIDLPDRFGKAEELSSPNKELDDLLLKGSDRLVRFTRW
jgi:hypothetical protein